MTRAMLCILAIGAFAIFSNLLLDRIFDHGRAAIVRSK